MIKRIFLYCIIAAVIFVGAREAIQCQETDEELLPITIDVPVIPLSLIIDLTPATFPLAYGVYGWIDEDGGAFFRAVSAHPGALNASATLQTKVSAMTGGTLPAENGGFFMLSANGFMTPLTGRALAAGVWDLADVTITGADTASFNIRFKYQAGFDSVPYQAVMTFLLTAN